MKTDVKKKELFEIIKINFDKGDNKNLIKNLKKLIKLEDSHDKKADYLTTLGFIYFLEEDYIKSEAIYNKVVDIYSLRIKKIYSEVTNICSQIEKNKKIFELANCHLKLGYVYNQKIKILTKTNKKDNIIDLLNNKKDSYGNAENLFINIINQSNDNEEKALCYKNIGLIFYNLNKKDLAEDNYKKALNLTKNNQNEYNTLIGAIYNPFSYSNKYINLNSKELLNQKIEHEYYAKGLYEFIKEQIFSQKCDVNDFQLDTIIVLGREAINYTDDFTFKAKICYKVAETFKNMYLKFKKDNLGKDINENEINNLLEKSKEYFNESIKYFEKSKSDFLNDKYLRELIISIIEEVLYCIYELKNENSKKIMIYFKKLFIYKNFESIIMKKISELEKNLPNINTNDLYELGALVEKILYESRFVFDEKQKIAHYTKKEVLTALFDIEKIKYNKSKLRVHNSIHMNDPNEGAFLEKLILHVCKNEKNDLSDIEKVNNIFEKIYKNSMNEREVITKNNSVYLLSFSKQIDLLEMWISYSDYAKGVCILVGRDFFEINDMEVKNDDMDIYDINLVKRQQLYEVKYFNLKRENVFSNYADLEKNIIKLKNFLIKIFDDNCADNYELLNAVGIILDHIRFIFKDKDYSFEQEVRLIRLDSLENTKMELINNVPKIFTEFDGDIRKCKEIIFGSKFSNIEEYALYIYKCIGYDVDVTKSSIKYK